MMKHTNIWNAVDTLAKANGLSASGLAKKAGLDPTTFNKSKRITADGKQRWPSTESIAKILEATNAGLDEFFSYVEGKEKITPRHVPLIGFAQAGAEGYFDDAGYPTGGSWEEIDFPGIGDRRAYALEISGDSMDPVLRDGDIVIISPEAGVRRGDRVVVKTKSGEVMAKTLKRKTATNVELSSFNKAHEDRTIPLDEVEWISRIVWAAQ
ncbi:MAG: helix-turn-helix transcriptional regulator [Rhodospirillaceae bacterium]|nr:helix-turn-helix transcriptional regulator [Rhodospirillaceae bacterium]